VQVRRAYKFRAYLMRPQEGRAVRLLADHCNLYNAALEEWREAWRMRKVSVSYGMQSAQLKDIRKGLHPAPFCGVTMTLSRDEPWVNVPATRRWAPSSGRRHKRLCRRTNARGQA
jgi:hypothetical protein